MFRYIVFVCFLCFSLFEKVWSQENVTTQIFAEVIEGLAATENQSLNFGRFIASTNGGSIVISPEGKRLAYGGVLLRMEAIVPGKFLVEGDSGANFII